MKEKSESAPPRGRMRATSISMANADRHRVIAGISNVSLLLANGFGRMGW